MNAAVRQPQSKVRTDNQGLLKIKEGIEMRLAMRITEVKARLDEILATRTPAKLLGGLAVGALLITATALPFGLAFGDEPSRPLSSEQNQCYAQIDENACTSDQLKVWLGIDPSSGGEQTYLIERDEAEQMVLDELAKSFIGVPALASSETTQAFQVSDYWVQRAEADEMLFDDLREALIGKPVSSEQMKVFESVAELNSLYPDTPYYRDPDWREGQMVEGSVSGAAKDRSADRPLSNREIERLDYEIDSISFAAAHNPPAVGPLSNREIERMDYAADMILLAEAQNPSAGSPLFSGQFDDQ